MIRCSCSYLSYISEFNTYWYAQIQKSGYLQ